MPVRKPDDPYDARMSAPEGRPAVHDHGPLDLADLDPDPIVQVRAWLVAAEAAGVVLANAMALATVGSDGAPSVRHVLLRDVTDTGITFFTNRTSRKARELGANPRAASTLYWRELDRQVCLRGPVTEVSAEDSDAYFATRPRDAQLGAWASEQSRTLEDRATLERRVQDARARFGGDDVPRPEHWGGYLLTPDEVECWQGRPYRLHDRFRYTRADDAWRIERLYP
jgi:pyridoxamine 5'-phosphate oxidase